MKVLVEQGNTREGKCFGVSKVVGRRSPGGEIESILSGDDSGGEEARQQCRKGQGERNDVRAKRVHWPCLQGR